MDRRLLAVAFLIVLAASIPVRAGEEWQLVSEGYRLTEGPAPNAKGEVFFTDIPNSKAFKIGLDGQVSLARENTDRANGQAFGPDGRLYVAASGAQKIVAPAARRPRPARPAQRGR